MPTAPIEPITSASASRTQAWRESGVKPVGRWGWLGACTRVNFFVDRLAVKHHAAILGMRGALR
jgi:hypothetical protein